MRRVRTPIDRATGKERFHLLFREAMFGGDRPGAFEHHMIARRIAKIRRQRRQ